MDKDRGLLANLFLFEGVPEAAEQVSFPTPVSFAAGETIYAGQDYRRALGVMLSGKAAADPGSEAKTVLAVFAPGAVFGAAAIFGAAEAYVSRIRALSACRVQFLTEEWLRNLFAAYPQTAINYIAFLSSRVRFLNQKIALFTQNSTEGKVYGFLSGQCDENGELPGKLNLSRLAEQLCIGRTSLYRALDALEQKQFIVRKNRKIQVIL